MASTFIPHSRTAAATICSTSSLLLLGFTLSRSFHFYCYKRLLGRNNTATASAPHKRCQHLLRGALLLSCSVTILRLFLRFFLSPLLIPSCQLTRPCQDISSRHCNCQFRIYFYYITDQSGTLFKKFILPTSRRLKGLTPLFALLLIFVRGALLTTYALLPSHLSEEFSS